MSVLIKTRYARTSTRTHEHTHGRTHAHTYTHTDRHTHKHTHTQIPPSPLPTLRRVGEPKIETNRFSFMYIIASAPGCLPG